GRCGLRVACRLAGNSENGIPGEHTWAPIKYEVARKAPRDWVNDPTRRHRLAYVLGRLWRGGMSRYERQVSGWFAIKNSLTNQSGSYYLDSFLRQSWLASRR